MRKVFIIPILLAVLIFVITACTGTSGATVTTSSNSASIPEAEVIFQIALPNPLSENAGVAVEILDETTGLAFASTRYQMQTIDPLTYFVRIVVPIGSVLKYRYVKISQIPTPEYNSSNQPIRYRMISISGPAVIHDSVAAWIDSPFSGATGSLQGQIVTSSNVPVPGLMVLIDGMTTMTASDGTFNIQRIPIGEHTLVAFSLDGSYNLFQQGAVIAENALTPAVFQVTPSNLVNVTFSVTVPDGDYTNVPVRVIGSFYQLGNTYSDQDGGLSTIAVRAPTLLQTSATTFSLTMQLPAGSYLEYKYTLGDGFWNSEHNSDGTFKLRKVLIPNSDTTYKDTVTTWSTPGFSSITFTVTIPTDTPASDTVSIQFNPFTWTNPIPMWSLGSNQWYYTLYSPLDYLGQVSYRYCRNDQCGIADNSATVGFNPSAPSFSPAATSQSFVDNISTWNWFASYSAPSISDPLTIRNSGFLKGVQWSPYFSIFSPPGFDAIYTELVQGGSNWLFLTPTWHVTTVNPPALSALPGFDALWTDIGIQVSGALESGLQVAIYPHIVYEDNAMGFWQSSAKDEQWWQDWFAQYRKYIINFADVAAQNNTAAIVIGGSDALPFLSGGKLPDGSSADAPVVIFEQWSTLITEIRARYSGKIIWAIPYPLGSDSIPSFLDQFDAVYIEIEAPLSQTANVSVEELTNAFSSILQQFAQPIQQVYAKPVIIGLSYPSADGAGMGCVISNGSCVSFIDLHQPSSTLQSLAVDLQEQADIYLAALRAVNQASWINGFISMGYFPFAQIQDASLSINGKPAEDILNYYFLGW